MSPIGKRGTAEKASRAAAAIFQFTGINSVSRRILSAHGKFALNFHGVSKRRYPDIPGHAQPSITVDDMREIMRWLRDRFAFLGPEDFFETRNAGVLLTFDDGFANNATNVIPLLEEFQAPAVFFVSTQHVLAPRSWLADVREKAKAWCADPQGISPLLAADLYDGMSATQLAESARHPLVTVGSHTVSHPFLTSCNGEQVDRELRESRGALEEITGRPVELFAYPSGDYDRRILDAVAASGYRAAFALDSLHLGSLRLEIPRVGIYDSRPAYLASKMSGLHRRPLSPTALEQSP